MQPLRSKAIAAVLAGSGATACAFLLEHLAAPLPVMMGASLCLFGVLEKLMLDAREARDRKRDLREAIQVFFTAMQGNKESRPHWQDLQTRILRLLEVEPASERRRLLNDAFFMTESLRHHVTFLALREADTASLEKLRHSLE